MAPTNHTRRRVLQLTGLAAASGAVGVASAGDDESNRTFTAELSGEGHGIETPADGITEFEAFGDREEVEYRLSVHWLCDPTQAHIHLGEEGEDGPVVAWLYPEEGREPDHIEGRFDGLLGDGVLTAADLVGPLEGESIETAAERMAEEGVYVNVHTVDHPGGEIRGQIRPDDPVTDPPEDPEEVPDEPEEPEVGVEEVATGLTHPWAIAVLPEGDLLVTEREGELLHVDPESGDLAAIEGVPEVHAEGQGGLLDVELHPDYEDEPWVYLTYAAETGGGESATHLGRGRFDAEAMTLESFEELYVAEPPVEETMHYGSRVVFDEEGMLYLSLGDRRDTDFNEDHTSQDLGTDLGTTLRLKADGSIPEDNPFVGEEGARDAIYTYGHRNVQAMTVHPETGEVWQAEHGEEDGDEINRLEAGGNYGWPIATYACEYGTDDPPEVEGTIEPVHYWECGSGGFPPSGATFYDGDAVPAWEGNLFAGTLTGQYLGRFAVDGAGTDDVTVEELDPLLSDREWRVRAVVVDPGSGGLYVAVDDEDAPIVRLRPE